MNTKINVGLLLRVADQISKTPEQFEMNHWDCGTAACIGGWIDRIDPSVRTPSGKIGVSMSTSSELFHECMWPIEFQFLPGDSAEDRAEKAVRRIHSFLDEHAEGWRNEYKL